MSTFDHQLVVNSVTQRLNLLSDENGTAMYSVIEDVPQYRNPLKYIQDNWIGGHGQYDFKVDDVYFEGQSIDTTQDGKVILGPEIIEVKENDASNIEPPICFAWYPAVTNFYCATNTKVYVFDATNVNFVACNVSPANVTDLKVFNGIMYAARGTYNTDLYHFSSNGDDFVTTDLTNGYAQKFAVTPNPAGTAEVLWNFRLPNEAANTTDGRTVALGGVQWASPNYVGDTANNITNIFLINDNLMIGREDGLWHLDSNGGIHQLLSDLRFSRSTDNFKYVADWQSGVYFSLLRGMGEITSFSSFEPMGPLTNIDDIGKIGDVVGIATDKEFIYAAMDEGTNTIIYKFREVRDDKGLRWQYCPFVFLGTNACTTLAVSQHSSTDRRLWFGYGNNAGFVRLSDNPQADTLYRYCANGWGRMSYDYGTNPKWDKLYQSILTQTSNCKASQDVIVSYRQDTQTAANAITAAIVSNGTITTNLTSAINCNRVQFQLNLRTATNTISPEITYFEARGVEKPETIRVHECVYSLGDSTSRRTKAVRTFLRGARTTQSLIKFADLRYGDDTATTSYVWVVMQPGYPQEIEVFQGKGKQPELGLKVRMQEVTYTIS